MIKTINLNEVIRGESLPPACDTTLGVKVLEAGEGYAKGIWTIEDHLLNGNGVIMGGFVAAAADIMMAYAITPLINENQTFASINLQTTFHRPTFTGEVDIDVKVERLGRTVSYLTADLKQNGKLTASVTSSIMIMDKK
ncbi:PaaI family thioesterase [Pseudobacillus wudalianchiensis]|uniref:Thioesterase n=1 Tax=Pseudobacillus wudalianchiensis TaxID=1743143 RepID=A0A1B9ATH0_9BACI|nr:PaaI family thioesterase [Bacillus wudalianchiensis]OCA87190.1 thioesterase [Bacillus wudalianchiensis]